MKYFITVILIISCSLIYGQPPLFPGKVLINSSWSVKYLDDGTEYKIDSAYCFLENSILRIYENSRDLHDGKWGTSNFIDLTMPIDHKRRIDTYLTYDGNSSSRDVLFYKHIDNRKNGPESVEIELTLTHIQKIHK